MLPASEVRARILDIVRRRQKPGAGSSPEFLRRRSAVKQWPDLTGVLSSIRWATVGGVATRHYAPERTTIDLDVLVEHTARSKVHQQLQAAGYRYLGELPIGGSPWSAPDGPRLDVIETAEPWAASALEQAQQNRDLQGLPVLPLPYFTLMKLRSGRGQDVADLMRMLGQANQSQLDAVRDVVRRYEPDSLEDVESMTTLGRMELE